VRRAIVIACGRRARRERQPALLKHKSESSGAYRLQADTAAAASVTPARAISRPRAEHRVRVERQRAPPEYVSESSSVYRCQANAAAATSVTPARAISCARAEQRERERLLESMPSRRRAMVAIRPRGLSGALEPSIESASSASLRRSRVPPQSALADWGDFVARLPVRAAPLPR
jgi:hypothetical protein